MDHSDQSDSSNDGLSPLKGLMVFAPAKINLFLHITGCRRDGYHELQSLVGFADIGDMVHLHATENDFTLSTAGPFAPDLGPDNLAGQAAQQLAASLNRKPHFALELVKNLPIAAGLGGGSSDAAATLWGMLEMWRISPQAVPQLDALMLGLGADVPACFACRPVLVEGVGELITPLAALPEMPVLLVNPGKPCPTPSVFKNFDGKFAAPRAVPDHFTPDNLLSFLDETSNMLEGPACQVVPDIKDVLAAITARPGCDLARLSGSGATCFGLFSTMAAAEEAAQVLTADRPGWWVKVGMLNRPERY